MFARLFLLFVLVPLADLALLLWLADRTSWLFTLALIIVTGVVGAALTRWQGWQTMSRVQQELARGEMPTTSLLDGLMILLAGALLITPGLITDATGFLLLCPPVRTFVRRQVARSFKSRFRLHEFTQQSGAWTEDAPPTQRIIDVQMIPPKESSGKSTS